MKLSLYALVALLALTACSTPGVRQNNANRLAMPVFMIPRVATIDGYQIKLYERAHAANQSATIYIEDSGEVLDRGMNLINSPTPKNPIALSMAAMDRGQNVIYLARPCQFGTKEIGAKTCAIKSLTTHMFAPEMITLYNNLLNDIKVRYQITDLNLVGYGTGGGLATILAGERSDVVSLRTVAGVLDTTVYTKTLGLEGYEASLNPVNSVPKLITMPQHHYLAQMDDVVPNLVYHSYAQAFGDNRCLQHTVVQNVTHTYDWQNAWANFVQDPVTCENVPHPKVAPAEYAPASLFDVPEPSPTVSPPSTTAPTPIIIE